MHLYVCIMPGPKRSKIQQERDRTTIAELYLRGWSQSKIGDYLDLDQSSVCRELKKIRAAWKAEAVRDYDIHIEEQMLRLSMIEAEHWGAWQRSQASREQTLTEKLSEAVSGSDSRVKDQKRTESRVGDPRFLEGLLKCIQERSKLLGLCPTTDSAHSSEIPQTAPGLSPAAVQLIRAQILGVTTDRHDAE